jgi:lipopolysaccharide/colanic/teichoic acid biosynthesis glycosyltransferase
MSLGMPRVAGLAGPKAVGLVVQGAPHAERSVSPVELASGSAATLRQRARRRLAADVAADLIGLAVALGLAQALGFGSPGPQFARLLGASVDGALFASGLLLAWSLGRNRRPIEPTVSEWLPLEARGLLPGALGVLAVGAWWHRRPGMLGVDGVALVVLAAGLLSAVVHALAPRVAKRAISERVLVVGSGRVAGEVARRLERVRGLTLVGLVDDERDERHAVVGRIEELFELCCRRTVDRVVVAFSRVHPAVLVDALRPLDGLVALSVVTRYFDLAPPTAAVVDLRGLPTLALWQPAATQLALAAKRVFDIVAAAVLLVVTAPLVVLGALAMQCSARGPVLLRQVRLGKGQQPFTILKLRTMRHALSEAALACRQRERGAPGSNEADPRITRVGRLLRRAGIDELPQLVNVLRGEMSLVGPRPFVPEESGVLEGAALCRFRVRPGLTGLWQICGQHDLGLEELCRLDALYVQRWSFGLDLRILWRTPGRLLAGGGKGAQR